MLVKLTKWPEVLPNDNGIRPAGKENECFYCKAKIGEQHLTECVCVTCLNRYEVRLMTQHGPLVGTLEWQDPHFWDEGKCNFHKNGSTWCADNAVDSIKWKDDKSKHTAEQLMKGEHCACGPLAFVFDETIDEGPFVEIREKEVKPNE